MAALCEEGFQVLPFFLPFVLSKDLGGILLALRFGIGVHNSNINDAIRATCPYAMYKNISTVVVNLWVDAFDNMVFLGRSRCSWVTGIDSGFVADS